MNKEKIAVLGTGNGGQAIAAYLALKDFNIALWGRNKELISSLRKKRRFRLIDKINEEVVINTITDDIQEAIKGASIIMIVTTADAHREIAKLLLPFLEEEQIIILNPGRTLGALEVRSILEKNTKKSVYVCESQSLMFACRIISPGEIRIFGIKNKLPVASMPSMDLSKIFISISQLFEGFSISNDTLVTGLENIGAIFHPLISILNANKLVSGESFFFYHNLKAEIGNIIEKLDKERIELGKSYNKDLIPAKDWISSAYSNVIGETLYERIISNPAYLNVEAPKHMCSRLIFEDVPTGLVPMVELSKKSNIQMPLAESIIHICSALCNTDYFTCGRSLINLGINDLTKDQIINLIKYGSGFE